MRFNIKRQAVAGIAAALCLGLSAATAAAWEPVVGLARGVLEARVVERRLRVGAELDGWREIVSFAKRTHPLELRLMVDGYPDRWNARGAKTAALTFRRDLRTLGVQLDEAAA